MLILSKTGDSYEVEIEPFDPIPHEGCRIVTTTTASVFDVRDLKFGIRSTRLRLVAVDPGAIEPEEGHSAGFQVIG